MSVKKRLQVQINGELHKTLMSISQTSRGQFVNMALTKFMQTDEGKNLVKCFATYQPNTEKIERELTSDTELENIMGDFG